MSCGCLNREILSGQYKDETGRRYGRVLVLGLHEQGKGQGASWKCRCDCGIEFTPRGSSLRKGTTTSCGCVAAEKLRASVTLPDGTAAMNQAIRSVFASARSRGIAVALSRDQIDRKSVV